MNGADIIAIVILAAIVIAIIVYLLHWLYRHSSKDLSFVRTGFGGERVVMGGGALVLPIVHDITEVSMNTLRIDVRRAGEKSLITRNRMRIEVNVEFFVRVIPSAEAVAAAARTLGNRTLNPDSLKDLVQGRFVDAMGSVAARMTMEEIHENRSDYIKSVKGLVADSLTANGLELEAVSLTGLDQTDMKLFNPSNAFDAEGLTRLTEEIETRKKKRNDIEQDTMIAIRKKNLESEKLALSIDQESEFARLSQESEVAMRRAQQKTQIALEKTERERDIEEAQIRSAEIVQKSRINQTRAVDSERILQEQKTSQLDIQRRRALELEEQERVIAVAAKSKDESEAQAQAESARALMIAAQEKVITVRETEIAERRKSIDLIEATQEAERDAIKQTKQAEAALTAAVDQAKAERASAEAAAYRYQVDADGKRKLNESENLRSDASRRSSFNQKLIDTLPSIIRESVKPMENIESIRILQVDGVPGLSSAAGGGNSGASSGEGGPRAGSLSDNVVNSALRYRAQAPFIDTLLQEIGVSPSSITSLGHLGSVMALPVSDNKDSGAAGDNTSSKH
ncbi:MAG: flotillin family protein [Rhodoferax sp.]